MRERPILLNADMVRAVLNGSKTQTRRIMKVQPKPSETRQGDYWFACNKMHSMVHVSDFTPGKSTISDAHEFYSRCCPFGAVGDRLWVRETFMDLKGTGIESTTGQFEGFAYRADTPPGSYGDMARKDYGLKWTPSLHMPRKASRITLEITGVRVERLQDISEADAASEGVPPAGDLLPDYPGTYLTPKGDFATARVAFQRLWESIYKLESWQANPWVWVIEFKRVEGE